MRVVMVVAVRFAAALALGVRAILLGLPEVREASVYALKSPIIGYQATLTPWLRCVNSQPHSQ